MDGKKPNFSELLKLIGSEYNLIETSKKIDDLNDGALIVLASAFSFIGFEFGGIFWLLPSMSVPLLIYRFIRSNLNYLSNKKNDVIDSKNVIKIIDKSYLVWNFGLLTDAPEQISKTLIFLIRFLESEGFLDAEERLAFFLSVLIKTILRNYESEETHKSETKIDSNNDS